jgi:hypothetical protein
LAPAVIAEATAPLETILGKTESHLQLAVLTLLLPHLVAVKVDATQLKQVTTAVLVEVLALQMVKLL